MLKTLQNLVAVLSLFALFVSSASAGPQRNWVESQIKGLEHSISVTEKSKEVRCGMQKGNDDAFSACLDAFSVVRVEQDTLMSNLQDLRRLDGRRESAMKDNLVAAGNEFYQAAYKATSNHLRAVEETFKEKISTASR